MFFFFFGPFRCLICKLHDVLILCYLTIIMFILSVKNINTDVDVFSPL